MSKKLRLNTPRKTRGPNKPKPITEERKIVSRVEAARITGYHPDSLKRLEKRRGGPLDVVKLRGPKSNTFYRVEQINALIEGAISNSAPNESA
jgi:hypothetical protein